VTLLSGGRALRSICGSSSKRTRDADIWRTHYSLLCSKSGLRATACWTSCPGNCLGRKNGRD
jgi:hypothetical protein